MSKTITASLVPFFDRLASGQHACLDGRLLDARGLQQSLQLDLLRLFNVRNSLSIEAFLTGVPTVLDYGLPDMLSLSAQSEFDRATWARVVERSIALYESRLSHVRVKVEADPSRPIAATAAITAAVRLGEQLCRVDFDVAMHTGAAAMLTVA